jgi:hypothetical protein
MIRCTAFLSTSITCTGRLAGSMGISDGKALGVRFWRFLCAKLLHDRAAAARNGVNHRLQSSGAMHLLEGMKSSIARASAAVHNWSCTA